MRVIAGAARGRPLLAPESAGTRPTGDKVKGAMFSLLDALAYKRGFEGDVDEDGRERFPAAVAWPRVLDLYAGSGALGIEALSRGAEMVTFVEADPRARSLIETNLRRTGLVERAAVSAISAERVVSTLGGSYDLILADPPYANAKAPQVLAEIAASRLVGPDAVLVWEHRSDLQPPANLGVLQLQRARRHGIAAISLYTRPESPAGPEGADRDESAV